MILIKYWFLNLPSAKLRSSKDNLSDGYQGIRGTRGMKWRRRRRMTGDGWTVFAIHKCNSARNIELDLVGSYQGCTLRLAFIHRICDDV